MHIPTQAMELVNTSSAQLYISPPQLCHTLNNTVGMLSSAGGSCGAALGSINFIAYFYNPTLCMHPPSHLTTSALTVHTAVKFCVSPCFMVACSSSHSWFLYLYFFSVWDSLHLFILSKLLALVDGAFYLNVIFVKQKQFQYVRICFGQIDKMLPAIALLSSLVLCIFIHSKCSLYFKLHFYALKQ